MRRSMKLWSGSLSLGWQENRMIFQASRGVAADLLSTLQACQKSWTCTTRGGDAALELALDYAWSRHAHFAPSEQRPPPSVRSAWSSATMSFWASYPSPEASIPQPARHQPELTNAMRSQCVASFPVCGKRTNCVQQLLTCNRIAFSVSSQFKAMAA